MKAKTAIFIVEEHHEAYFIWKYAVAQGRIKNTRNTLLHIDEHSDMGIPFLNTPAPGVNGDLNPIRDFTHKELGIATFITPAIYEGLFDDVYWIKQHHSKTNKKAYNMYIRSQNNTGTYLAGGQASLLKRFEDEANHKRREARLYRFYKQHIRDIKRFGPVVLDIDLDYFSCIQNPLQKELRVEITREEYQLFHQTPYHRIRFFDFGRVDAICENDRYYYYFNRIADPRESPLKVSNDTIQQRIDLTVRLLQERVNQPLIITICRSRQSGYTPHDQCEFIEEKLLEALNNIYDVETCLHVDDVPLSRD